MDEEIISTFVYKKFIITSLYYAILFYFLYYFGKWLIRYLRLKKFIDRIPGPPAVFLLGNIFQLKLDRIEFADEVKDLTKEYGEKGIYRMWLGPIPLILLTKARTAEAVFSSNKLLEKSSQYDFLKNWIGTGLLTSSGVKWRTRRKILTPTFHFSILNNFMTIYNKQAKICVDQLSKICANDVTFNLYPFMSRCALDVLSESAMGVQLHAQENHESEYVQAVAKISEIIFKYERMPWLRIKIIFELLYGKEYRSSLKVLRSFIEKVISERIRERNKQRLSGSADSQKRQAFLDLLLNISEENNLKFEDFREEVDTFMFAGHDSTSSNLGWTLFLLGHHPEIQKRVYEEQISIFGNDSRDVTVDDLKDMKYLECVVKESLRLYPPVAVIGRKVTEDFETGGYLIPAGCSVMMVPFSIHRDTSVYGDDVESFKPERFFSENCAGRHPYAFVPFSAGFRNCIGQKFALMEDKVILSILIRNFKFTSKEPLENVKPIPDLVLRPSIGFPVCLEKRRVDITL